MTLEVVIAQRAREQLRQMAGWWAERQSMEQAELWYDGFIVALESLAENPKRCPLAREHGNFPFEMRELHYGLGGRFTHRAVFTIRRTWYSFSQSATQHSPMYRWK